MYGSMASVVVAINVYTIAIVYIQAHVHTLLFTCTVHTYANALIHFVLMSF